MRIMVSGATGLIGRALVKSLTAEGIEVIALSRDPVRAGALLAALGKRVQIAGWNARSSGDWFRSVDGCDAIVNLAGENLTSGRWNALKKRELLESRLRTIDVLLDALRIARKRPSLFIQASAVGYYGPRGNEELDETADSGGGFLAEIARQCELSAVRAAGLGVRTISIRTGVVLDSRGGALPRLSLPYRFGAGGYPARGTQWVSWIHIDDEVRAIRFLISSNEQSGAFNLTAPEPVVMKELCRGIGSALRRPTLVRVPAFALRALFGEMADEALLAGQRIVPVRLVQLGFSFRFPTLGPALHELLAR